MKGKVIFFNQEKLFGFILGENGYKYFFHTSDVNLPLEIKKNKMVTFKSIKNQKGLCAKNIILEKNKHIKKQQKQTKITKKRFEKIGDITLNLNDVISAEVHGNCKNAKLLIKTYSSGTLISYYNSNLILNNLINISKSLSRDNKIMRIGNKNINLKDVRRLLVYGSKITLKTYSMGEIIIPEADCAYNYAKNDLDKLLYLL